MSEWFKVVVLGFVEGTTEFLPVSSTGHLIVTAALLDFQHSLNGTFEIFIQLGAVIAVLFYYRRDLIEQVKTIPVRRETQRFWFSIGLAVIPAAVIGLLIREWIKEVLFSPVVVAVSLIVGGLFFLWVERHPPDPQRTTPDATHITLRQALIIGLAQLTALIPGISRSGASIIGGMQAGLSRPAATQFSFYLAIPTLGGATVIELLDVIREISGDQIVMLLLGALVSGVVAWASIGWLLRYVAANTFVGFGYYRIAAGIVILLALAFGIL